MPDTLSYAYTRLQPFHLSVGAVLFDDRFHICVHHFTTKDMPERLQFLAGGLPDYYHLMRETLEFGETPQYAVHRGLQEEFGAFGSIEKYLGVLTIPVHTPTTMFMKTTLYHAVRLERMGGRTGEDEESKTSLTWITLPELITIFHHQKEQTKRLELDESEIIERFMQAYGYQG